jgi:hypothetical protein
MERNGEEWRGRKRGIQMAAESTFRSGRCYREEYRRGVDRKKKRRGG